MSTSKSRTHNARTGPSLAPAQPAEVIDFNRRGLFIGGAPKSGTTLLLSLLDGHPQLVVVPEETQYLEERGRYRALKTPQARLHHLLHQTELRVLAHGRFAPPRECRSLDERNYAGFQYDRFAALADDLARRPGMNDSLLFSEMVRAYAEVSGIDWRKCVRWVEKSTSNEVHTAALDELFPQAKLVQVIRDPRAVFASRKKRLTRGGALYSKAHRLLRAWNKSAKEISRLHSEPSRFLVVRYEDLVSNPARVLKQVCQFGDFDFTDQMLTPTRAGNSWEGNSAFEASFFGISGSPLRHWRDYLTPHEIWWVELHCKKGMRLAGYELVSGARFSLARWLKRLPRESRAGYFRARRASLCHLLGWLHDCRYECQTRQTIFPEPIL